LPNQKRRFSNYLLNKSLQLRYVVLVTALSAVITGALGFLIWRQETFASEKILTNYDSSDFSDPELKAAIVDRLSKHDSNLVLMMSLAGIGLVIGLSIYLIVMTHKVAGPLYKVGLYFDKMADGRLDQVWPLRKGDMLVDFYERFQSAHEAVRRRHRDDNAAIGRFLATYDQASLTGVSPPLGQAIEDLRSHHAERERALA
jgi:hypothetical protein